MSRENVEVVVGQFEGVNRREFAAVMDAYSDDVTLVLRGEYARVTGADVVTGKEAVGEWFGDWFRQFAPDYRFEVKEARDLGDRVLLIARHYGRGRVSGASVSDSTAYPYAVRGGKVSRVELWDDREKALEAAGLSE